MHLHTDGVVCANSEQQNGYFEDKKCGESETGKDKSPEPPPRPRTPIDERDPEQVRAENRYLSYFSGPPHAKHPNSGEGPSRPPSFHQEEAEKRYSNYFADPPRAQTTIDDLAPPDDPKVLAAQRRYNSYFQSGPPSRVRPRSCSIETETSEEDFVTKEAQKRYMNYFKSGPPRPRSLVSSERTPEPDDEQIAAEKRYLGYFNSRIPRSKLRSPTSESEPSIPPPPDEKQMEAEKRYNKYFEGMPKKKHLPKDNDDNGIEVTKDMIEAEERFLKYFNPVPCGRPKKLKAPPPPTPEDDKKRQLLLEFQRALEVRISRKQMKVVKVSKAKNELEIEVTPPTLRDKVVEEFLKKVKDRKKEKDLHFGDTDSEDEEDKFPDFMKPIPVLLPVSTAEPVIQGGGTINDNIAKDLKLFLSEEAFQRFDETGEKYELLGEIEKALGFEVKSDHQETLSNTQKISSNTHSLSNIEKILTNCTHNSSSNDWIDRNLLTEKELQNSKISTSVQQHKSTEGKHETKTRNCKEVWSPGGENRNDEGPSKLEAADLPSFKDVPPVWTPGRGGSESPSLGRKEYKKITYEGTNHTMHKRSSQESINTPHPEDSFAWKNQEAERLKTTFGSSLPRVQSPTVTLLQKKREGQIPVHRPEYIKPEETPFCKPGDKLYTIKREYESEDEECGSRKFAVLGPKKYEGVGPTTREGIPTTLKSGVKSEHQGEWYRRMFDSLHKVKDARYGGGYMSEPEGYESDYGSRYATLDRKHNRFEFDDMDSTARNTKRYVHQPGRIENYVPGFSSLSEKELRDNPDADVKLEIKTKLGPTPSVQRFGSGRMQMSHALKESGYESDSTVVFRKREDQRRQLLGPKNPSKAYKEVQLGGEIPLSGLQKPAPPRPKDQNFKYKNSEVNIHYRTPVRLDHKETLSEEELARRQEDHMKKIYEQERRKKYLQELEDIEKRRHTDFYTPLHKPQIPLNRYDDGQYYTGARTLSKQEPKQVAKALFNFSAQNKRELNFNKGDLVTIRRMIDKNWYEGEMRGTVGIFPCNYVEVIPVETIKSSNRKPTEGQARARFNFTAQTAMEMSLVKGELVVLSRRVDDNWYEGRIGNRKGIFPCTYVDTLIEPGGDRPTTPGRDPIPRPALPAAHLLYNGTSGGTSTSPTTGPPGSQNENKPPYSQLTVNTQQDAVPYRALYNYKPQNEDELELLEGDTVLVMEKCDDGWFVGTSKRTGLFGTFPGNYVEKS